MLDAECITTEAGMAALAPEWRTLWASVPGAGPFQSFAWAWAWWSQFGTSRPVIGIVRDQDRLLGLLPAYVLTEAGGTKVLPIGVGISDNLDALIAPDAPEFVADRLLAAVLAAADADRCDLAELPPESALRTAQIPDGWRASLHVTSPCPVLGLPRTIDDLRQILPGATHRKLRMNRHRAARAGGATMQTADEATLSWHVNTLFALHQARWASRGEPGGVLSDPRVQKTLIAAAPELLDTGVLRLTALRIGGDVAAACMAFNVGQSLLLYMSGFAESHGFCSPGSLLLGEMAESAIREGRSELHFLRGGEPYKYAWGAADRHNATLSLVRR